MEQLSEIEAIKKIDETLSKIDDSATLDRILKWACDKFSTELVISSAKGEEGSIEIKKSNKKRRATTKKKLGHSIVKELDLNPSGKKSLKDFIEEKKPKNDPEKCTVCIYYLKKILDIKNVETNHVYTCFKDANWRIPANLENRLQYTASQKGWIDTSNMKDIKIMPSGENLVELDLPRKKKSD